MRPLVFIFLLLLSALTYAQPLPGDPSVLSEGKWAKLSVEKSGVYKIGFDLLKSCGFDPSKIDPRKIKLYGNRGGMLPQSNATQRTIDLIENSIFIEGESDGVFNKGDYILFYAEGPDESRFDLKTQNFFHQTNLYSTKNFVFLTVANNDGKRVQQRENIAGNFPQITQFDDYGFYEKEENNELQSGREWFGDRFGISTNELVLNFPLEGIGPSTPVKIVSDVMGQSYTSSSFNVFFNDVQIAEQQIAPIPNTRYGLKGIEVRDTLIFNSSQLLADSKNTQVLKYVFNKGVGASEAYLDYLLFTIKRKLALYGHQTIAQSSESIANPVSTFLIDNAVSSLRIWDVTDPSSPYEQLYESSNGTAQFAAATTTLRKFVLFDNAVPPPSLVGQIENQNLKGLDEADIIIISHPAFVDAATRLKNHRESADGLTVHLVTTEEIFNEFSGGRIDVTALRDFIRWNYDRSSGSKLKSVLLFGKGSFDYKDRIPGNTNFVPTYESRNSLHPLETYSSDDYFGFLENTEGEWLEGRTSLNHTMDIGVGRLPVTSLEEAQNLVDKLIAYDTDKTKAGSWRKKIVFVADDGNNDDGYTALHQSQADQLSKFIETLNPAIDSRRLFIGTYEKTVKTNGESIPELTDEISRSFDLGALIVNYTGHGNERQWADEKIFSDVDIRELRNNLHPFMVTATCEFGRNDNPRDVSSAELAVKQKNGGVIGMVTTARPVNATTNFNLNKAFYEALLTKENGRYLTIGEVFRRTKNNSASGVSNRNFALLGDPSMTLALPPLTAKINSIKTVDGSDTLKALSEVIATGAITAESGTVVDDFNGTVEITLFDKQKTFRTIGKNDPPFEYKEWSNALFRGKAKVVNGNFSLKFMLPGDMARNVDFGRLSIYATDSNNLRDAIGSLTNFKVGEVDVATTPEAIAPSIRLFIGDTTFVNGGIAAADTYLVAQLTDNTAINISGYSNEHNIMGYLDGDPEGFVLNDYFIANEDAANTGWLTYPLRKLTPGRHQIKVQAWDIFNNVAESTIDFVVTDGEGIVIEDFGNYPNPFAQNTTLFFRHNRSGDDLQAQVFIHKITGELLERYDIDIPASEYQVDVLHFEGANSEKKLKAGLYLARLVVRSLANGSKNERVTKLIVLN